MSDYAHAQMLVSTEWVNEHKNDANVVIVEIDVDTEAYDQGHLSDSHEDDRAGCTSHRVPVRGQYVEP